VNETVLNAVRGNDNFYNFDITGDIDAGDLIWFRAARREVDLTDAAAVILKTRASGGIADLDTPNGKFQVQLEPADTAPLLADEALVFHVVIRKVDVSMDTTVAKGLVRLT